MVESSMTTEEREQRRKEMGEAAHEKVVNTQLTDRQIKRRRSTFMKLISKRYPWLSREMMLLTYDCVLADNKVDTLILELRRGTAE